MKKNKIKNVETVVPPQIYTTISKVYHISFSGISQDIIKIKCKYICMVTLHIVEIDMFVETKT